jgi:hypothetical protein
MPVAIEDRPIEAVREEVIDQLIMNYSHGVLSYEAFERRLDKAMESTNNKDIVALVADLHLAVDKEYVESKKRDLGKEFDSRSTSNTASNADFAHEESENIVNIFSGSTRSGPFKVAKEMKVLSIFSGSTLDFTDASFPQTDVTITIFSLFSGDDILVPENVHVVSKVFSIFGCVDVSTPVCADRNAPRIIVEGVSLFSGIDIKVKRTLKEKFIAFADNLKNMFH